MWLYSTSKSCLINLREFLAIELIFHLGKIAAPVETLAPNVRDRRRQLSKACLAPEGMIWLMRSYTT
ncbi:hypothetical protein EJB05_26139 [Eragrostis curvula]|uniref:Uncharacterized protein n=1 Tax=Eragrostis curvula TaxID=38414 RepID=A0A5J9UJ00_9POAL|nr:hypothetical protein EJB05_26139 [Eragrostis curvula]